MASGATGGASVPALWSEINRYGQNGDFTRALKTVNKILQINKDDVTALHCKVVCLIQNGSFKEALNVINTHTKVLAKIPIFRFLFSGSRNDLSGVVDLTPTTHLIIFTRYLSFQLYRLERYDECLAVYRDLVRNSQDDYDEERKTNLSAVVAAQSNWEKVVPENLGLQEGTHELCYNAACALIGQGQLNQAMKFLQKAEGWKFIKIICNVMCVKRCVVSPEVAFDFFGVIKWRLLMQWEFLKCHLPFSWAVDHISPVFLIDSEEALQLYNQIIKLKPTDVGLLAVIANNIITINKVWNIHGFPTSEGRFAPTLSWIEYIQSNDVSSFSSQGDLKKKKKKKKGKLPKNYDPKVTPDPERWLPMRERSYYRGRKKGKKKDQIGKGTQGATAGASSELDASKTVSSPPTSPRPGSAATVSASTSNIIPPRHQKPAGAPATKKKQQQKKKKGGKGGW
ncbi:signal recognition particle subunit SRP72 [Trichechus manatus latirostris]|uniref:Signal recognition particle subunit SRP72 n=1 Tax=Trichechus manatus latirostris TaxID=127582 RepID=A0A2Y9RNN8_TRIMA|nr:signal recognition particle subunit SRP72 [Trichechus manatus latirostris]